MKKAQRIILAVYCILLAYCCVWIPWSITSSDRYGTDHQRLGYGWIWAGPQYPTWPKQQGQYSVRDIDRPPGAKAAKDTQHTSDTPDFSDVDDFVKEQAEHHGWDAMSRYATPDMTLIAFRIIAISLISTAAFILFGIRRMPATHG